MDFARAWARMYSNSCLDSAIRASSDTNAEIILLHIRATGDGHATFFGDSSGNLTALITKAGLPVTGPALGADVYLHHMRVDKKAEAGDIRFVLIDPPGSAKVRGAPDALVAEVVEACCRA